MITVVTCTIGDSAGRLSVLLYELPRFTTMNYRHIVCDDGTLSQDLLRLQQDVCKEYAHVQWMSNAGPTWGISYNFNYALDQVTTPWALLCEDGFRPSMHWLETACDAIEKIGSRTWNGRRVGMMGMSTLEDWTLAAGRAIDTDLTPMDFLRQAPMSYEHFYGGWNDGWWSWPRLLPGFWATLAGDTSSWGSDLAYWRDIMRGGICDELSPADRQQAWQKWHGTGRWPRQRTAGCGWYPGPALILNLDAWRRVGKMRDGCTFFEGHLGTRMGINGFLSLVVETPPFLHQRSQGFRQAHLAATPRDHQDTVELFRRDFGHDHMDAPNVLASGVISVEEQQDIGRQLAEHPLDLPAGWERWA